MFTLYIPVYVINIVYINFEFDWLYTEVNNINRVGLKSVNDIYLTQINTHTVYTEPGDNRTVPLGTLSKCIWPCEMKNSYLYAMYS